jgi:hypothetical protein
MRLVAGIGANGRLSASEKYYSFGNFDSQPPVVDASGFLLQSAGGDYVLQQVGGDQIYITEQPIPDTTGFPVGLLPFLLPLTRAA